MKVFSDSADYNIILKYSKDNLVKGFTTNPSLMRLAGAKNYKSYSLKLIKASNKKPISLEVFSDNINEMYKKKLPPFTYAITFGKIDSFFYENFTRATNYTRSNKFIKI